MHLNNRSTVLAFQIHSVVCTPSGGLIVPIPWSDTWIELVPGESRTLTALLLENSGIESIVQLEGRSIASQTIMPTAVNAH